MRWTPNNKRDARQGQFARGQSTQGPLPGRLGPEGELYAAAFLEDLGFRILERNYRIRGGEIDLVVSRGGKILFVEVKTRRSFDHVSPLELIPFQKQRHLVRVARHFIMKKKLEDTPSEFALVIVDMSGEKPHCELVDGLLFQVMGY